MRCALSQELEPASEPEHVPAELLGLLPARRRLDDVAKLVHKAWRTAKPKTRRVFKPD